MAEKKPDPVIELWEKIKPYWHVISFVVTIAVIFAVKWSKVDSYDNRIIALEVWRIEVSRDMATMQQEIHDIHEQVVPRR